MRKKALVTGATGFIGAALGRRMALDGWLVRGAVRNLSDGNRLAPGIQAFPVGPIGAGTDWTDALAGVDVVVHLAARTHITRERDVDPLEVYRSVNVAPTARLAREAARAGVKRFVYVSSVKVNGEGRAEPYTERDMPAPEDPYGNSKWEAEQALIRIASETGMEIVIIRPPLVYGPGVRANFYELLKLIQRGIPLPFADVNNRRSLIYLGNLIDAIIACSVRREAAGKTFLASDGVDVSTPELVRRIAGAFNRTVRLFSFPETIMRSAGRFIGRSLVVERLLGSLTVDTSSIQRELGWKAPYTMEQGLQETAHWFKNRYGP